MTISEINLCDTAVRSAGEWTSLRMPISYDPGWVTVIIPVYNRADFAGEAIDSVWSQTFRPIELIVVDDGSADNTADVVRAKLASLPPESGFRALFIRQRNRGASAARNQGLIHSKGEFIQHLDSDDVLVKTKLDYHVQALRNDNSLDLVWSDWCVVPADQFHRKWDEANQLALAAGMPTCNKTDRIIPWEPWPILARRLFVASQPLWNELVLRHNDWEYAVRLLAADPKLAFVPGIYCIQREHGLGRLYDYYSDPKGVELGLMACREAAKTCMHFAPKNRKFRQLVGERYWLIGLEALLRGTDDQAIEAFGGAASTGTRVLFRLKGAGAWLIMKLSGRRATRSLLARYLANKWPASPAAS